MDATESLVRERFESALADVQLNVASLVGAGAAEGQRLRRRRRFQVATAAVASVAVIAAAGLVGIKGGLFDNATPPAHEDNVGPLVPSNPRAFAAAVVADLPSTVKVTRVVGGTSSNAIYAVQLSTLISGRSVLIEVAAHPKEPLGRHQNCKGGSYENKHLTAVCTMVILSDGANARIVLTEQDQGGPQEFASLDVFVHRPTTIMTMQISQLGAIPGGASVLQDIALRILNDPAVGPLTYQRYIDAQGSVPHYSTFPPETDPPPSSPSSR